jgi:hypothetical protein
MNSVALKSLGVAAAIAVIAAFAVGASAQEKKATPAKRPPACNSVKVEADCRARTDCNWVAESKDAKGKVTRRAYCRANPTPKKK